MKNYFKELISWFVKDTISYETQANDLSKRVFCSKFNLIISPGKKLYIPTGFKYQCPDGYQLGALSLFQNKEIFILDVLESGDEDTLGEITLLVKNKGKELFFIPEGSIIASIFLEKKDFQQPVISNVYEFSIPGDNIDLKSIASFMEPDLKKIPSISTKRDPFKL